MDHLLSRTDILTTFGNCNVPGLLKLDDGVA